MNIFQAAQSRKKVKPTLVITIGESNSGGYALNSQAPSNLIGLQTSVKILNNTTLEFEDLNIGANNIVDHYGLDATTHGFELLLAQRAAVYSFYNAGCKLIKTGQGGSTIGQWVVGDTYFTKLVQRIEAAQALINFNHYKIVIVCSFGINDMIAGTPINTWKTNVSTWFANIRAVIGQGSVPIIMTGFESMGTEGSLIATTNAIQELTESETNLHKVTAAGAALRDQYHWNYFGMRTMATRILTKHESL
jgi:hypothetical protein